MYEYPTPLSTVYCDYEPINTFRKFPKQWKPPKAFLKSVSKELIKVSSETAKFKNSAPSYWPEARKKSRQMNHIESHEIIMQEWRSAMVASVIDSRLNKHNVLEGPVTMRSANGILKTIDRPKSNQKIDYMR